LLFANCRGSVSGPAYHFNADPDPAFHVDVDPDPDPTFPFDADPDPQHYFFPSVSFPSCREMWLISGWQL